MFKFSSATDKKHFVIVGILVAITSVIMFFLLDWGFPLPEVASEEAITIDGLIRWHIVIIAFLFALVMVLMFYTFIVFRKRQDDESEGEHFEGHTGLEIAWTAIPLVVVVIFCFYGVSSLNKVVREEPNEMVIKVEGRQWSWSFEYEGGVVTDTMTLPINQPIHLEMHTADVMHGFWVPEFRVKQDLVPGAATEEEPIYYTHLRFTPTKEGEYKVNCTVLCGLSHWQMVTKVRVVPPEEFAAIMKDALATVNPALASK